MRKIVSTTYMTLDGDVENMQDWHFTFLSESDECNTAAQGLLARSDALIMGRRTYEGFAPAWTERAGADEFADRMNSIQKYVVSNTITDPTWNNTAVISGDVVEQVRRLKEQDGADILQYGFGPVTRLLLDNGLLDEVTLWLHPMISGKAEPSQLFYRDATKTRFALEDADVHSTGMIILTYRPLPAD